MILDDDREGHTAPSWRAYRALARVVTLCVSVCVYVCVYLKADCGPKWKVNVKRLVHLVGENLAGVLPRGGPHGLAHVDGHLVLLVLDALVRARRPTGSDRGISGGGISRVTRVTTTRNNTQF